ncbi:MAG: hypothetical protein M3315_12125 [Actinomycetota bacterium]|jgi:hypothetical protein|nr:hypothetical protein [Actinomycetota bacterium]
MTARERTLWEQAVRVLQQNTVTTPVAGETARVERVLFMRVRERTTSQRRS